MGHVFAGIPALPHDVNPQPDPAVEDTPVAILVTDPVPTRAEQDSRTSERSVGKRVLRIDVVFRGERMHEFQEERDEPFKDVTDRIFPDSGDSHAAWCCPRADRAVEDHTSDLALDHFTWGSFGSPQAGFQNYQELRKLIRADGKSVNDDVRILVGVDDEVEHEILGYHLTSLCGEHDFWNVRPDGQDVKSARKVKGPVLVEITILRSEPCQHNEQAMLARLH